MLAVSEALAIVLQHARPLPVASLPLGMAHGAVLAEDVASDLDMPPFDKSMMDGYAVRAVDLTDGHGTLTVVEEVTAGRTPTLPVGVGEACRIMTGAPLPIGADAVVPVEQSTLLDDKRVRLEAHPRRPLRAGQHVMPRGREMRLGQCVLTKGTRIRPQEIGVLATVGRDFVAVQPTPIVAVLSTGDEVVEAGTPLSAGQIRNSNGPMLTAQIARAGAIPTYLGIARDRVESLEPLLESGLRETVLLISGGVSAGKLDLVPDLLRAAGVEAHFHSIRLKPGKPLFFGTRGKTLVFGLPGNPVSSFVCFELFVRPALRQIAGFADASPRFVQATLAEDVRYPTDRPTYHPAVLNRSESGWDVRLVPWFGSPDLLALTKANALVVIEPGQDFLAAGKRVTVVDLE